MATELEQLVAEDEDSKTALEETEETQDDSSKNSDVDEETRKAEEHLENVKKAIVEANETLRKTRQQSKTDDEEELPELDHTDPSVKRWKKEINDSVSPVQATLDNEKQEVRDAALESFLQGKPALAKDPEKVKSLMDEYERLSHGRITELQRDGVTLYLEKAYASVYHKELSEQARQRQLDDAESAREFSEPAIDSGATTYRRERDVSGERLSAEDLQAVIRMYGSRENYEKAKKEAKASSEI